MAGEPVRAVYGVHGGGMQIAQIEVMLELTPSAYSIDSRFRFTGLASWFAGNGSTAQATGVLRQGKAQPRHFSSYGHWRGEPRTMAIEYQGGQPRIQKQLPATDPDREPVPTSFQHASVDALSALLELSHGLGATGRCEGEAALFDGRRSARIVSRTDRFEMLPQWRGTWSGQALRCTITATQTGGFRRDDREATREPQEIALWMARPASGMPFLPVRFTMPGRWLGPLTGYLLETGTIPASASSSNLGSSAGAPAIRTPGASEGSP
ncbi:DUF3108 domain-containing protein [Pseudoroseomonas globiformis]|uniref:DUF3108 domain-containing protein n=1 Tax=Teichococcus globiformis TaxID=2307229 RepID=A0ABV7G035_9PROT